MDAETGVLILIACALVGAVLYLIKSGNKDAAKLVGGALIAVLAVLGFRTRSRSEAKPIKTAKVEAKEAEAKVKETKTKVNDVPVRTDPVVADDVAARFNDRSRE